MYLCDGGCGVDMENSYHSMCTLPPQSVDINTPTIKENTVGTYKSFGLKNSCIALIGLCEISAVRSKCSSECAVWDAKDSPCAGTGVTKQEAKSKLCSVFDPEDTWIKMGMGYLPVKTCKVLHQCSLESATTSTCARECADLKKVCEDNGVTYEPDCPATTTTTAEAKAGLSYICDGWILRHYLGRMLIFCLFK